MEETTTVTINFKEPKGFIKKENKPKYGFLHSISGFIKLIKRLFRNKERAITIHVVNDEPIEKGDYFIDSQFNIWKCYGTDREGLKKRHFTVEGEYEWVGNNPLWANPKKIVNTTDKTIDLS